eukprot:g10474.t1
MKVATLYVKRDEFLGGDIANLEVPDDIRQDCKVSQGAITVVRRLNAKYKAGLCEMDEDDDDSDSDYNDDESAGDGGDSDRGEEKDRDEEEESGGGAVECTRSKGKGQRQRH